MNSILTDLSAPALTSAIEENLYALFPAFSQWPQAQVHVAEELTWSMTDFPFPLFNSIMRARLVPAKIDAAIEPIIAAAKSRNVPLLWWLGPMTRPADLGRYLESHGFVNAGEMPGMAIDLRALPAAPALPDGFTIQQVRDPETLKLWSQVCAQGFELPDFVGEGFYDFMCHVDLDIIRAYLGWLDGKPVATSLLALGAGVAGLYNITTLPEARRKGIGARMTDVPLLEVRALGYQAGILHASEMGEGVYLSLGFKEYCKIGQYIWSPQS